MANQSSHLKAGIVIGSILGVAAGLFIQSRRGKQLTKDAGRRAVQLQAQLMKKLRNIGNLTKEKYTDIVEHMLAYYMKTKEIAKNEVPEVRAYLLKKWKEIEREYKNLEP